MLHGVPIGFCRDMTINAAESMARHNGIKTVDEAFLSQVLDTIKNGSAVVETAMQWSDEARLRLQKVPDFVRGMLIREIEGWAAREGKSSIELDAVKAEWQQRGVFHLDPSDPRSQTHRTTDIQSVQPEMDDSNSDHNQ
ncbi:MAG: PCP reductase family protein [Candidatus Thiodiazotropha sp. (ex Ustalcina ferruginea)]|nr:PCP reductase family protein [Candidatus Thiodiazotropha sp. (ex Ustalcina ferruginea)]